MVGPNAINRRISMLVTTSALSLLALPALAQEAAPAEDSMMQLEEVIVTAQRQAQSLQDVPIAVTAFGSEDLDRSGTQGVADLQFALPNVTFTKDNFTTASFQIRGVGRNAVGASTDESTGIHFNDVPVGGARFFEIEFYDIERVEVLRGPQGTQFGRNSTGGTVNIITRRPTETFSLDLETEATNYEGFKVKGAVNVPLGENLAARFAGIYMKRDGYTHNLASGTNIDGRDQYSFRGSLRFTPSPDTTIDLMASTYRENSDRSRVQKQMCNRDVTGIYGCLPNKLEFETVNANATLSSIVSSRQFVGAAFPAPLNGAAAFIGITNLAGADSLFGVVNPADYRTVNVDFLPTYKSKEDMVQLAIRHDFEKFTVKLNAGYTDNGVDSRTDLYMAKANNFTLPAFIANPALAGSAAPAFGQIAARLFSGGQICTSNVDDGYVGYIAGNTVGCSSNYNDYDRSFNDQQQYSIEGIVNTNLDGPLNFLVGLQYANSETKNHYSIAGSGLDYASALLGLATGQAIPASVGTVETDLFELTNKAIFGEVTYEVSDSVTLTAGLRYNEDKKFIRDRTAFLPRSAPVNYGTLDARPAILTAVPFREDSATFKRATGRLVLNWKPILTFTDDTLVYLSFSRGYKGGGFNPQFDPTLFPNQKETYKPESINAFELGTKNRFGGGRFQANLTAFYYDYKDMQISTIISRTSFNANVGAKIYGLEGEFVARATNNLTLAATASWLKTKIGNGVAVLDPSNPLNDRTDGLLIKDLESGNLCAVLPTTAGANVRTQMQTVGNTLVAAAANPALAAQAATLTRAGTITAAAGATAFPVPEMNHFGNFSACTALRGAAGAYTQITTLAPGFTVTDGVPTDLSGNQLQNSPRYKLTASADYTYPMSNGMSLNARIDYSYQAKYYGSIFNRPSDLLPGYDLINARLSLIGEDNRWSLTAFVENLENDNAVTGLYVHDQIIGLVRNVFTTEPRRYGLTAALHF